MRERERETREESRRFENRGTKKKKKERSWRDRIRRTPVRRIPGASPCERGNSIRKIPRRAAMIPGEEDSSLCRGGWRMSRVVGGGRWSRGEEGLWQNGLSQGRSGTRAASV